VVKIQLIRIELNIQFLNAEFEFRREVSPFITGFLKRGIKKGDTSYLNAVFRQVQKIHLSFIKLLLQHVKVEKVVRAAFLKR
jgi:hypothetical protein